MLPGVKEIREFRVVDIVEEGRICQHQIDAARS
jgi:hypothetical protein